VLHFINAGAGLAGWHAGNCSTVLPCLACFGVTLASCYMYYYLEVADIVGQADTSELQVLQHFTLSCYDEHGSTLWLLIPFVHFTSAAYSLYWLCCRLV
jgi:hypothetical protein